MRTCCFVVLALLATAGLAAQASPPARSGVPGVEGLLLPAHAAARRDQPLSPAAPRLHGFGDRAVIAELRTGDRIRATELCFGDAHLLMAAGGGLTMLPLDAVLRVSVDRDPVWDGAAGGAGGGLALWKFWLACGTCGSPERRIALGVAASAGFGLLWDAMQKGREPVRPRAELAC